MGQNVFIGSLLPIRRKQVSQKVCLQGTTLNGLKSKSRHTGHIREESRLSNSGSASRIFWKKRIKIKIVFCSNIFKFWHRNLMQLAYDFDAKFSTMYICRKSLTLNQNWTTYILPWCVQCVLIYSSIRSMLFLATTRSCESSKGRFHTFKESVLARNDIEWIKGKSSHTGHIREESRLSNSSSAIRIFCKNKMK